MPFSLHTDLLKTQVRTKISLISLVEIDLIYILRMYLLLCTLWVKKEKAKSRLFRSTYLYNNFLLLKLPFQ